MFPLLNLLASTQFFCIYLVLLKRVFNKHTLILFFFKHNTNMKIFKHSFFSLAFIFLFIAMPFLASAQLIDPCTDPDDPCPIDSGVVLLVVAVIAIAAKKTFDYRKQAAVSSIL